MKKYILCVLLIIIFVAGDYLYAQTADGGIFGSGSTLTVKFKPSADITGTFTQGNFGIRWLHSLGDGVNLSGESGTFGYVNQGAKALSGLYDYIVYASASGIVSTTYTAGTEYTLMTVTVSGGVGVGSFELCPDGFASNAGIWYIVLGGVNRRNPDPALWYYQQTASDVPLPVELITFTASINQSAVNLKWQTKTEVNNYGFEVERASSMTSPIKGWEKIGFVNGHGNSNSPKDYSLTDKNPTGGSKFIYRLKQIDNDGKFKYSDQVEIELVPNEFNLFQNYPNPFNPATNIKFALPKAAKVTLLVYNLLGEKIATLLNEDKEAGFYNVQFDASSFSSGVYIYRLTTEDFIKTMKMNFIK